MRNKKRLMAVAMIVFPLASVTLVAGTASASTPTASGGITCAQGGTIDFNPSLTFNGTAGSKEVVTFENQTFSGCTTHDSAAPEPTASVSVKTKTIKIKGVACQGTSPTKAFYDASCHNGKPLMTGSCSDFSSDLATVTLSNTTKWNAKIKPTRGSVSNLTQDLTQYPPYVGSTGSGTSTGSFAGSVSTATFYEAASSTALVACKGGSNTPLGSLTIDSAKSTITDN